MNLYLGVDVDWGKSTNGLFVISEQFSITNHYIRFSQIFQNTLIIVYKEINTLLGLSIIGVVPHFFLSTSVFLGSSK